MPLLKTLWKGFERCSSTIRVAQQTKRCMRPAKIRIDRKEYGIIFVCRVHMNDAWLYAEVKQLGLDWQVVGSA